MLPATPQDVPQVAERTGAINAGAPSVTGGLCSPHLRSTLHHRGGAGHRNAAIRAIGGVRVLAATEDGRERKGRAGVQVRLTVERCGVEWRKVEQAVD